MAVFHRIKTKKINTIVKKSEVEKGLLLAVSGYATASCLLYCQIFWIK